MKYDRTLRISEEIKKLLSSLLADELKDPGIPPLTTITRVQTTNDLRYTTVYFSFFGEGDVDEALSALNRAKGFIRREIGARLDLRYTPEPLFKYDDSLEYAQRMSKRIDEVNSGK